MSEPIPLSQLQKLIQAQFGEKDQQRGVEGTFMWLMEEIGELSSALRSGPKEELAREFADVWPGWRAWPMFRELISKTRSGVNMAEAAPAACKRPAVVTRWISPERESLSCAVCCRRSVVCL